MNWVGVDPKMLAVSCYRKPDRHHLQTSDLEIIRYEILHVKVRA